jgi:hypothetical protein
MTIIPIDDYSPVLQGDTGTPFSIFVVHKNGFESLTGATITMVMQNVSDPTEFKTCGPNWTVDPSNNGHAFYAYDPSDVNTPGSWYMWVKVVFASGRVSHPDDGTGSGKPKILQILPLPVGV